MPRSHRPTGRTCLVLGLAAVGLASVGACGSSTASPSAQLATRAQDGLLQSYSAAYKVTMADGSAGGTVTVWRTPSRLRLDVKTAAGVSSSITTPERTVACQRPAGGKKATCLVVAGPGKTPPAAFDPVLRKVFGDALRVLAEPSNGLQVAVADSTGGTSASPAATPSGVAGVRCFVVKGSTSAAISDGTYCLDADGVPVSLTFPSASAELTTFVPGAQADARFAPVVPPTTLPSPAS